MFLRNCSSRSSGLPRLINQACAKDQIMFVTICNNLVGCYRSEQTYAPPVRSAHSEQSINHLGLFFDLRITLSCDPQRSNMRAIRRGPRKQRIKSTAEFNLKRATFRDNYAYPRGEAYLPLLDDIPRSQWRVSIRALPERYLFGQPTSAGPGKSPPLAALESP
jgi:hypothetical protein